MGLMEYLKLSLMTRRLIKFHGDLHIKIHINPQIECPMVNLKSNLMARVY